MAPSRSFLAVFLIALAVACMRLLPHAPNFVPVTAVALLAGAKVQSRMLAYLIPLLGMILSDFVLGFHSTQPVVYAALLLTVNFGRSLSSAPRWSSIALTSLFSSLVFFVITNLGVFFLQNLYPKSVEGLLLCFTAALPFFERSVASDLFYSLVFFGVFALFERASISVRTPLRA